jgi:hypothetical protein
MAACCQTSRLVVIHRCAHISYECVENLVAEFIDEGTTASWDDSYLEKIRRPLFLFECSLDVA